MIEEQLQIIPAPAGTTLTRTEVYSGFQRQNLRIYGNLTRPAGDARRKGAVIIIHPSSNFLGHPMLRALAQRGIHALGLSTRYLQNDTALIMENCLLDLGAGVRWLKERCGYENVVLAGWSGGGALVCFYQSQAEAPDVTHSPSGDPPDLTQADLPRADAVATLAAHASRAKFLEGSLDPSVIDELDPFRTDPDLDLYAGNRPLPLDRAWLATYRAAQQARMARITYWVKQQLASLPPDVEDRVFLTYRTMADPRWLDPSLDPNDRVPNTCHLGEPRKANNLPSGLGRVSTLRSWLSQWSAADSNADAVRHAARISVPVLVVRNGADQACFPSDPQALFAAVPHADKQYLTIAGADHYYANIPEKLHEAAAAVEAWLRDHALA